MRIADRHIEWDARSVLTWQYDKAVNMIAFLSLWQKWIDINCNQVFYGSETRLITKDNYKVNGYPYDTFEEAFDSTDKDIIVAYTTVDTLKSVLISVAEGWRKTDETNEAADASSGSTIIKDKGRYMVNHIGDMFKMRKKKLYKYSLNSDGSFEKKQVNSKDDDTYEKLKETETNPVETVESSVYCGNVSGSGYWFETEYEYTYVTWNGEQWITCPTYNSEYAGGWFADIYAIDTCNEFGLLLWAKLIGVELPTIYGTETTKTVDNFDEQNEVWRTYLKARFYRILTNGSMNDIVAYLHHVFAQFDNHEIQVEDGGSYELGTGSPSGTFTEEYNTESSASGSTESGYVCTIAEVQPNEKRLVIKNSSGAITKEYSFDFSANPFTAKYLNDETIIKVGYKVNVVDVADPTADPEELTVVSLGNDCITASHAELGTKTCLNKVKVKFLEDWKEGYTIKAVGRDSMTVEDSSGNSSDTVKSVCVYSADDDEWHEGYAVESLNEDGTVCVIDSLSVRSNVEQTNIKVHFYGDWQEGYTVDEVVSDSVIIVVDEDGEQTYTVNDVCVYNSTTEVYDEGYVVKSVDHSSFCVSDGDGVKSFAENQYVTMVNYADIKYFGVNLMTIKYSCEFDQNDIERAILNISDFLPHPSAVLSENTMSAGDDIVFGFNSHNFNSSCLPTIVKDAYGNSYYVYPYQDSSENDCDIPAELSVIGTRTTTEPYLTEKANLIDSLRKQGVIDLIAECINPFVCFKVEDDGSRGDAMWAIGTKWDCHIEGTEDPSTVSRFVGQTSLYKYNSDGTVMTGSAETPIIYNALVNDAKLKGYIRKVAKYNNVWCYYDGMYNPTDVDINKWEKLTSTSTTVEGVTTTTYSYSYTKYGSTVEQTYVVEFDDDGEPKYVNSELRCYKNHSEAQNAIARIESYNDDNGDATPLVVSSNQNIANLQTVSYASDFFDRYLMLANSTLAALVWKEFNLFKRKDIDPKNGGYFKGGQDSTPVGLTEIIRVLMPLSTGVTKGTDGKQYARRFELWHKNIIQRLGTMMENKYARKVWATDSDTSEDSYLHTTEFDSTGAFVVSSDISEDNRIETTEFVGVKIKYERSDRNRRVVTDETYIKEGDESLTHRVNERFSLENNDSDNAYDQSPASGTYIIDFVNKEEYIEGAWRTDYTINGVDSNGLTITDLKGNTYTSVPNEIAVLDIGMTPPTYIDGYTVVSVNEDGSLVVKKSDVSKTVTQDNVKCHGYEPVFKGIRFLYKLKDEETDDDTTLSWAERIAKYRRLNMSDVGGTGTAEFTPGTNAVLMPTCDYGFMKYNFSNVTESDTLLSPRVSYYYGFGMVDSMTDTTGGKCIPYWDNIGEPYKSELSIIELWGQNQLMTLNNGGLSAS